MKNNIYIFLCVILMSVTGCKKDEELYEEVMATNISVNVSFNGLDNVNIGAEDKLSLYRKGGNKVADLAFISKTEGIYNFSNEIKQKIDLNETYTIVYPASDAPVYKEGSGSLEALQNGSDLDSHLIRMGRYESDLNLGEESVIVLDNKMPVVVAAVSKPEGVEGIPIQLEFNVNDEYINGRTVYSKSVVNLTGFKDWQNLKISLLTFPKTEEFKRSISCVLTTSDNSRYIQDIEQDANVRYGKGEKFNIMLDNLIFAPPTFLEADQIIQVTDDVRQKIFIGLDAERLWYWRDELRDELAQLSVGDINVKFARVAIDCGYELEEGIKKPDVYNIQLNMMRALRSVRPDLLFFATPRPLFNSYTEEERVKLFGHVDNTPWTSVPLWACNFKESGKKKMPDGTEVPNYVFEKYDKEKLVAYFAEYLNFMHDNGFDFEYMDLTNETETRTTSDIYKYVYDNLPSKLNGGVKMPILIGPSSWSVQGGITWMNKVKDEEKNSFGVAAVHNTGKQGGTLEKFVELANKMGKPAWNTELHDWIGLTSRDEVLTSDSFFEYFRAGFSGMSGWLFFGPANGKDHSKLWVGAKKGSHTKSAKYEIFKTVVNAVNDGNYLNSSADKKIDDLKTTVFVKGRTVLIAVLNKGVNTRIVTYDMGEKAIEGKIEVSRWSGSLPRSGERFKINPLTSARYQAALPAESLSIFQINMENNLN